MADLSNTARAAAAGAQRTAASGVRHAAPWIEKLARVGYAAKGLVYVVIGVMAWQAARGAGGDVDGSRGAIAEIAEAPGGGFLLGLLIVGLAGYALWRFVQAAVDADDHGSDGKGLAVRAGFVLSGFVYLGLALTAVRVLTSGGDQEGGSGGGLSETVMGWPGGRWLLVLGALGVVGYGLRQLYRAFQSDLTKRLALDDLAARGRRQIEWTARAGTAARGVVFALAGFLAARAAWRYDPENVGTEDALIALRDGPSGSILLALVGAGLIAYGLYQFVVARYRVIRPGAA